MEDVAGPVVASLPTSKVEGHDQRLLLKQKGKLTQASKAMLHLCKIFEDTLKPMILDKKGENDFL